MGDNAEIGDRQKEINIICTLRASDATDPINHFRIAIAGDKGIEDI